MRNSVVHKGRNAFLLQTIEFHLNFNDTKQKAFPLAVLPKSFLSENIGLRHQHALLGETNVFLKHPGMCQNNTLTEKQKLRHSLSVLMNAAALKALFFFQCHCGVIWKCRYSSLVNRLLRFFSSSLLVN